MIYAFIQRLLRDESGVGLIELALVLPILALMFLGMVDLSRIVAERVDMEQAAQRTTDLALAKRPTDNSKSYLVSEAQNASGEPASNITVDLYVECNGVRMGQYTDTCAPGEVSKRFASVSIKTTVNTGLNWRGMAALLSGGSFAYIPVTVTGDSVVRLQ